MVKMPAQHGVKKEHVWVFAGGLSEHRKCNIEQHLNQFKTHLKINKATICVVLMKRKQSTHCTQSPVGFCNYRM